MTTDTQAPVAPIVLPGGHWTSLPQVTLRTSLGTIVFELYPNQAPISVANWLAYVDANFYSNLIFHRVIPGFMVQGGGFTTGLVNQTPLYPSIVLESDNGLSNLRGTLAMARTSDPNSATDQFYVNLIDNTFLNFSATNPGYAVFGKVTQGLDVIDKIAAVTTKTVGGYQNVPVTDVLILEAQEIAGGALQTSKGGVSVSGLESQSTWEYSLNNGASWTRGQGTSFVLPTGEYAADTVQVRQTDAAGNVSLISKLGNSVSVVAQSPQVSITSDLSLLGTNQVAHLSFVLSDASTDFTAADVHVQVGTLSAFTGSQRNYSAIFTPLSTAQGTVQIDVASGSFQNAAGKINLDDQVLNLTVDTQAPLAPLFLPQGTWTRNPVVKLQTSAGDVTVELKPNSAPLTTANWLNYVNTGFYDGLLFHYVSANGLIQGGTYNASGVAQSATVMPIALESNNGLLNQSGTLAMVHSSGLPDSATSGFFINLANNTALNYVSSSAPGYAVFGQVTAGLSVVSTISQTSTATGTYASIQHASETVKGVVQSPTGVIQIAQLENQASWQYSLDKGLHWQAGTSTSLVLPMGSYGPDSIEVRQLDAAGNIGSITQLNSVVNIGMQATHWLNHGVISDIKITEQASQHTLEAFKSAPANKADGCIGLTDILGALKIYLHKPLPTEYSSPYNVVAADFDGNGTVNLNDVLNLLKYYLGKSNGDVVPQWTFVAEGVTQANGAALSTSNALPDPISVPASSDTTIQLIGILRGDVDGSWSTQL